MHPVLNRELFLVKEKVGAFRAANHYDIFDPNRASCCWNAVSRGLGR